MVLILTTAGLSEWKLMGNFKLSCLPALDTIGKAAALVSQGQSTDVQGMVGVLACLQSQLPVSHVCMSAYMYKGYSGDRTHIQI